MTDGVGSVAPRTSGRRPVRSALLALAALLLVVVVAFVVWASLAAPAEPAPLEAVLADPAIEVVQGPVVALRPAGVEPTRAVVFYPGARVHRDAYIATWAPIVAATETVVLIPRMPLNLAIFGRSRAAGIINDHPDVETWFVGGHSLGGAMAASFAGSREPGTLDGLVLWASYATQGAGLADRDDLVVLSVSGSRDGLSTPADIAERRGFLPDDAVMVEIDGMNHAQFGRYGPQRGDLAPQISDEEATSRLLEAHRPVLLDLDG